MRERRAGNCAKPRATAEPSGSLAAVRARIREPSSAPGEGLGGGGPLRAAPMVNGHLPGHGIGGGYSGEGAIPAFLGETGFGPSPPFPAPSGA